MATLRALFGMGSVVVPLLMGALGVLLIARHRGPICALLVVAPVSRFVVLLTALHLRVPQGKELSIELLPENGGAIGGLTSWILRAAALGPTGAIIFLVALSLVALLFWSELSLAQTLRVCAVKSAAVKTACATGRMPTRKPEEYVEQVDGDWTDPKVESSKQSRREQIRGAERLKENQLLQQRLREVSALPEAAESSAPRRKRRDATAN